MIKEVVMLRTMSKTEMMVIIMAVIKLMSMITKNKPGVEKRGKETDHCGYYLRRMSCISEESCEIVRLRHQITFC